MVNRLESHSQSNSLQKNSSQWDVAEQPKRTYKNITEGSDLYVVVANNTIACYQLSRSLGKSNYRETDDLKVLRNRVLLSSWWRDHSQPYHQDVSVFLRRRSSHQLSTHGFTRRKAIAVGSSSSNVEWIYLIMKLPSMDTETAPFLKIHKRVCLDQNHWGRHDKPVGNILMRIYDRRFVVWWKNETSLDRFDALEKSLRTVPSFMTYRKNDIRWLDSHGNFR